MISKWDKHAKRVVEVDDFLLKIAEVLRRMHALTADMEDDVMKRSGEFTDGELVDLALLFRDIQDLGEELMKEGGAKYRAFAKIAGLRIAINATKNPNKKAGIESEWATASLSTSVESVLPARGSAGHIKLCEYFNLPMEPMQKGLLDFRWTGMNKYLGKLLEESKPYPPGLGKIKETPKARVQRKRNNLRPSEEIMKQLKLEREEE